MISAMAKGGDKAADNWPESLSHSPLSFVKDVDPEKKFDIAGFNTDFVLVKK
jgi:hypothetical protein